LTVNGHAETKFDDVFWAVRENVSISRPSPQKLKSLSVEDRIDVADPDIDGPACDFGRWSQHERLSNPLLFNLTKPELINGGNPSGADQRVYWRGRCTPGIFPNHTKPQTNNKSVVVEPQFRLWRENGDMGALNSAVMAQLVSINIPEGESEISNRRSREGGNHKRGIIEQFSGMEEREQHYVMTGAFLVAGLIVIAVFYIQRKPS